MKSDTPKYKRSKELQSQITDARAKMKEKVVENKKNYKRKPKHRPDET